MITYNEFCKKYEGKNPDYGEPEQRLKTMHAIDSVCQKIFDNPAIEKIKLEDCFCAFVQKMFNWSHYNELEYTEKDGSIKNYTYYSEKLKTFGTTVKGGIKYYAKAARVASETGYRWARILVKLGLLKIEKIVSETNYQYQIYFLDLDRFEDYLHGHIDELAAKSHRILSGVLSNNYDKTNSSQGNTVSLESNAFSLQGNTYSREGNTHSHSGNTHSRDGNHLNISKEKNKEKNKKTTTTNPEARIGDVDPNSSFSFSQEEDPRVKNKLDIENRSSTSEVKNLIVQPEKKLSLPSSSKKEEVKVIVDKHLNIQEPPYPPLTKASTPGTKEDLTAEKPKLALLHLNTNEQNAYGFREAAEKYRLVYSKNYHKDKATVEAVKGNECLYYITWTETGEKFLYVADYLASSTVRCSENYWRADYLSWTWEKEACWWTKLKQAKNTQSAIYELAQMHSKWLSDPYNEKYILCLSNRFLCFTNWEAANFPVIDNIDRLTLNEADQNLLKEMEVEINRLRNPNQMMMYYKEFVSQYLEQGGYNFEWEGFAAHDTKLCMKTDQPENLELLPVLGCYDNLIDGGKLQYFSVLDPDTREGKENKLTKFGNAGYPLNFFVGEFIKKYSRDALPEDILALLKEQAKIGLGLVDNSGTLDSDR